MKKTLTAVAAAGLVAFATATAPTDAHARNGGAVAAGIIGGIAAGAIIGGAIANSRPAYAAPAYGAYAPVRGYEPYEGHYARVPVACPGGYWARRPLVNQYGEFVGYSRPRFVCPRY